MTSIHASRIRARTMALAVALLTVVSAAGCGAASAAGKSTDASPVSGGTLKIVESADTLNCVDPFQTAWTSTRSIVRNVAESLVDQNPKTGEIKPWLAKSWTIGNDGKTYTFTLKKGITFSDGEKFDADAVVKTFTEDLQTLDEKPGTVGGFYVQNLTSVTKIDDYTVRFNLSAPNASLLQGLATTTLAIISPKSTEKTPEQRCLGDYSGTGPFTIKKYDVNTQTTLVRRKGHTSSSPFATKKGDAYLDKIVVSYVPENSVRIGNVVSGSADVVWTDSDSPLVENDVNQIKQSGGSVESRAYPGSSFDLTPNVRDKSRPLYDTRVRQALSLGIDRSTYATTIIRSGYPTVTGVLGSTTPAFQKLTAQTTHDADKAASLLSDAGWKKGKDGYRYKDGKKLTVVFLTTQQDDGAELIQDELKKIGIDYQIDVVTSAQYTSRINASDYDLASLTYTRADPSALNTLLDVRYATFKTQTGNTQNDEERAHLEKLFDEGTTATDSDKRASIYKEAQKYVGSEYILIPVYERVQDAGISASVHGIRFTAESFGDFSGAWLSR